MDGLSVSVAVLVNYRIFDGSRNCFGLILSWHNHPAQRGEKEGGSSLGRSQPLDQMNHLLIGALGKGLIEIQICVDKKIFLFLTFANQSEKESKRPTVVSVKNIVNGYEERTGKL